MLSIPMFRNLSRNNSGLRRSFALGLICAGVLSVGCGPAPSTDAESAPTTTASSAGETESDPAAATTEDATLEVMPFYAGETGLFVNSTLIHGETEAILVDTQYGRSDAEALVQWLQESGKTLTAIWITHAHPDHYFGTTVLKETFPDVPVYASPEVAATIEELNDIFIANVPKLIGPEEALTDPIVPTAYTDETLELEGESIELLKLPHGDTTNMTALYIPSTGTIVAGDLVYDQVHLFMNENPTPDLQQQWLESLDRLEALNPTQIIPGHQSPDLAGSDGLAAIDFTRDYLEAFASATALPTSEAATEALLEAFPEAKLPFLAGLGVSVAYGEGGF